MRKLENHAINSVFVDIEAPGETQAHSQRAKAKPLQSTHASHAMPHTRSDWLSTAGTDDLIELVHLYVCTIQSKLAIIYIHSSGNYINNTTSHCFYFVMIKMIGVWHWGTRRKKRQWSTHFALQIVEDSVLKLHLAYDTQPSTPLLKIKKVSKSQSSKLKLTAVSVAKLLYWKQITTFQHHSSLCWYSDGIVKSVIFGD